MLIQNKNRKISLHRETFGQKDYFIFRGLKYI